MRDALKGAAVGVFLLTAYVVAADYPPQGGGASGDFTAGGDSTFDSLTLDEANADVVLARSAAGTLAVSNGPEADGDGTLVVAEIQNDQGVVMVQGGTNNGNVSLGVNDTNIGAVGNLVAFGAGVGEAWGVLNGSRLRIKSGMEHVWSSSATDPLANAGDTFLSRASAGALRVGATTATGDGQLLCRLASQDHTAADTLDGNDSHKIHTNVGDADLLVLTLPAGSAGYVFTVARIATQEVRIDPNAADKILDIDMTGLADGEYITTSVDNSTITLVGTSTGDWIVTSKTGTWAEETP